MPGLRREEVADLADVSADYYTQLERGDVDGASDSVLNAVAVAHDTARILRSEAGRDPHESGRAELIEELSTASSAS